MKTLRVPTTPPTHGCVLYVVPADVTSADKIVTKLMWCGHDHVFIVDRSNARSKAPRFWMSRNAELCLNSLLPHQAQFTVHGAVE